jgi:hypothetical protein
MKSTPKILHFKNIGNWKGNGRSVPILLKMNIFCCIFEIFKDYLSYKTIRKRKNYFFSKN